MFFLRDFDSWYHLDTSNQPENGEVRARSDLPPSQFNLETHHLDGSQDAPHVYGRFVGEEMFFLTDFEFDGYQDDTYQTPRERGGSCEK